MNKPTLDELMNNVDSKYTLVVMAAKRARILTEQEAKEEKEKKEVKPVSKALFEIAEGKIDYEQYSTGIK